MSAWFIEHPRRRTLLVLLAALTLVVGGRVVLGYVAGHGPPRNDQATLDQLRSEFAQYPWEPSLFSASWSSPDDLDVGLDTDDRQLALTACSDLMDVVKEWTSTAPNGVIYTVTSDDRSLFIWDRSRNLLVTNFLSLNSGCRWRLN